MVTGAEFRQYRRAAGLKQEELARRLGYESVMSGVRTIQRWESGRTARPRSAEYQRALEIIGAPTPATLRSVMDRLEQVEEKVDAILRLLERREGV